MRREVQLKKSVKFVCSGKSARDAAGARDCSISSLRTTFETFLFSQLMTLEHLKHSVIISSLVKMADDNDLIGASEFIKGKFGVCVSVSLLL